MNITDYQDNSFGFLLKRRFIFDIFSDLDKLPVKKETSFLFFHSNSLNKKLELLNLAKY